MAVDGRRHRLASCRGGPAGLNRGESAVQCIVVTASHTKMVHRMVILLCRYGGHALLCLGVKILSVLGIPDINRDHDLVPVPVTSHVSLLGHGHKCIYALPSSTTKRQFAFCIAIVYWHQLPHRVNVSPRWYAFSPPICHFLRMRLTNLPSINLCAFVACECSPRRRWQPGFPGTSWVVDGQAATFGALGPIERLCARQTGRLSIYRGAFDCCLGRLTPGAPSYRRCPASPRPSALRSSPCVPA